MTEPDPSPAVLRYSAFTDGGRGGNPAGVVLDASELTAEEMLGIAARIGYSETAFLLPEGPRRGRIRYFSPRAEVGFCGHATIATAVAVADRDGAGPLSLSTPVGPVLVETRTSPVGTMATLTSPPASSGPAADALADRLLACLRWARSDVDPAFPVHVANAGNDHPMVAAATRERLASFDYDYDALAALMGEQGWTTVHAFWAESDAVFHARNAFPPGGVVEDPATGAAAAAFGGYLRALHGSYAPSTVTILQGQDLGLPSRLVVELTPGTDTVAVTGTATLIDADG